MIRVRGWLLIGPARASTDFDQQFSRGWIMGELPDATVHQPGHFIVWQGAPGAAPVTLVCVDVAL